MKTNCGLDLHALILAISLASIAMGLCGIGNRIRDLTESVHDLRKSIPHFTVSTNGFTWFAEGE